jgi:hypothetical protein
MNYKALDNSLHVIEPEFAHLLPAGCVPITEQEAEALRPMPDAAAIIEGKKVAIRVVREGILNRLSGIAFAAQLSGDTATTAAFLLVRQGLLDITANLPSDPALVDSEVLARYISLRGQCTPQMETAFAQVDA